MKNVKRTVNIGSNLVDIHQCFILYKDETKNYWQLE